ncbi:MAG: hypothetical protein RL037_1033 [Bacteroidota bacterium]|jgi:two-component system phosphate regulon sensor histidine kinase PhoR
MNNSRPSILILYGSLAFSAVSLGFSLIVHSWMIRLTIPLIIAIPLISGFFAYFIFYYLLKRFVQQRLGLIYRSIRNKEPMNSGIDRMVETAEMDVTHREEDQSLEITKLKEQEAFRREFLGNLAHELKTPVFSIQGYILTLLDGGIDDPKVNKSFLERASKASDRMASMLEDLDQITKLEANELNLQQRSFDITELVTELIDAGEIFAKEKEIKVSLKKDYPSTFVVGNRDKIGQVFTNLINNAIFYGNKNGFCKIGLNYFDDIIEIEVCDDGPGIDAKHLPRLFERFYRVEKSRNRHEGGSGLGLAIAKHIIESHGHKITVKSVVGLGSNFYFTLNRSKNNVPHSSRGIPLK